jgi:hypothetical protein
MCRHVRSSRKFQRDIPTASCCPVSNWRDSRGPLPYHPTKTTDAAVITSAILLLLLLLHSLNLLSSTLGCALVMISLECERLAGRMSIC